MTSFLFSLPEDHKELLQSVSRETGLSMAEHLRRAVSSHAVLFGHSLSGAVVLGIKAVTSSGEVWIGRGF